MNITDEHINIIFSELCNIRIEHQAEMHCINSRILRKYFDPGMPLKHEWIDEYKELSKSEFSTLLEKIRRSVSSILDDFGINTLTLQDETLLIEVIDENINIHSHVSNLDYLVNYFSKKYSNDDAKTAEGGTSVSLAEHEPVRSLLDAEHLLQKNAFLSKYRNELSDYNSELKEIRIQGIKQQLPESKGFFPRRNAKRYISLLAAVLALIITASLTNLKFSRSSSNSLTNLESSHTRSKAITTDPQMNSEIDNQYSIALSIENKLDGDFKANKVIDFFITESLGNKIKEHPKGKLNLMKTGGTGGENDYIIPKESTINYEVRLPDSIYYKYMLEKNGTDIHFVISSELSGDDIYMQSIPFQKEYISSNKYAEIKLKKEIVSY